MKKTTQLISLNEKQIPRWVIIWLTPLSALALSFVAVAIIVALVGENPWIAIGHIINGAVGSASGLGYTLYYSTNFIFTGLAVSIAFHAGLFNIGGEGQAHIAGLIMAIVVLALDNYFPAMPKYLLIVFAIIAAMMGGALWALIPAVLQAWRGSHVVITTIMFNFIASGFALWVTLTFLLPSGQSAPESKVFPDGVTLPFFHDFTNVGGTPSFFSPFNTSFVIAIITSILVWITLYRTKWGYELRVYGRNQVAANYAGINAKKVIVTTLCVSGMLAGLMAVNEVLVVNNKFIVGFTSGYGFVGIAVSLMGRNHPVGIILASLLFGSIYQGGSELSFEMPTISRDMVVVVQGLIILFVGALGNLLIPSISFSYRGLMGLTSPIRKEKK